MLLRPLIDQIVLHPACEKDRLRVELEGGPPKIMGRCNTVPRHGVTVAFPTGFEPVSIL